MIDFWELAGRLVLMDKATRTKEIYTDRLPLQADGSILNGFREKSGLPLPVPGFYNQMRAFYMDRYSKGGKLAFRSPVISMFALGESGVMFFTQPFRDLFDKLSDYLKNTSVIKGRNDLDQYPDFYITLAVLMLDTTTRKSVVDTGDFLGLEPPAGDVAALRTLAADPEFVKLSNGVCFDGEWTDGSQNTLRDQSYPSVAADGAPPPKPFRHLHFKNVPA